MSATRCESFWDYREQYRLLMQADAQARVAEPGAGYTADPGMAPLDERLIQTIWAQQLLQTEAMRACDGRPVRVLDPGRWNGTAGPDFRDARLMIGEQLVHGDVEIHLRASDWRNHGHHADLDYNGVVLHAVLAADDARENDTLHNGAPLPRLELEPYIFPDLDTLRRSMTPDDYPYETPPHLGDCHWFMAQTERAGEIAHFLDLAGDERLTAKERRLEEQLRQADFEQVFYQALMLSLGSGPSRTLYYLLAKRAALADLRADLEEIDPERRMSGLEAMLLHLAGLVPEPDALAEAPEASRAHADALRALWQPLEPAWRDRLIPPTRRWHGGVRPANFPTRRLAGVAVLLHRAYQRRRALHDGCFDALRAGAEGLRGAKPARRRHPIIGELTRLLTVEGEGHFWGDHYSFAAKPATRPMNLIGEGVARSLLLNAVLPAARLFARLNDDEALGEAALSLYRILPPLQPNHITQFMTRRLFGDANADGLIQTERRRQALFQIFHHCCRGEDKHCRACYFYEPR